MFINIILLIFCHLIDFKIFFANPTKEYTILTKFQNMKLHHFLGNNRSTILYTGSRFPITLFKMNQSLSIFIDTLTFFIVTFKF